MAADKPNVHLSLSKLKKEITKPEVLRMSLSGSKIITWPDMFDIESEEAEELFDELNRDQANWSVLRKWLSKPDADALKAEKLTVRELMTVVSAATSYYEQSYGKPGEGNASEG